MCKPANVAFGRGSVSVSETVAPAPFCADAHVTEGQDVTANEPTHEWVATDELARLRRIEEAARGVLREWQGRRSPTPLLTAIAALRAALKEKPA